jgi:hypothetical protein
LTQLIAAFEPACGHADRPVLAPGPRIPFQTGLLGPQVLRAPCPSRTAREAFALLLRPAQNLRETGPAAPEIAVLRRVQALHKCTTP